MGWPSPPLPALGERMGCRARVCVRRVRQSDARRGVGDAHSVLCGMVGRNILSQCGVAWRVVQQATSQDIFARLFLEVLAIGGDLAMGDHELEHEQTGHHNDQPSCEGSETFYQNHEQGARRCEIWNICPSPTRRQRLF